MAAAPKKIRISKLYPKIDDRFGRMPPDRLVTAQELLHPAILRIPDAHTILENAYSEDLYEIQESFAPESIIRGGDNVDLQAHGQGQHFDALDVVLINLQNHMRDKLGIFDLSIRGNHDIKTALATETEIFEAGLTITRGVLTKHPARRDVVQIHGHELESEYGAYVPTLLASRMYIDLSTKGEKGAAFAKHVTKTTTSAIGIDHAVRFLSYMLDADIYANHTHTVVHATMPYETKVINLPMMTREAGNLASTAFFSGILRLHHSGALDRIIHKVLIPPMKYAIASRAKEGGNDKRKRIRAAFRAASEQFLPLLEKDPHKELFDDMTLEKMRPKFYRQKIPGKKTPTGYGEVEHIRFGCLIDGRKTVGVTFADTGYTYVIDWEKAREFVKDEIVRLDGRAGLPDRPLAGNDLIVDHFQHYPLHPNTLKQLAFYKKYSGVLSAEDMAKHAELPLREDLPVIAMSCHGIEKVTMPDGQSLPMPSKPKSGEYVPQDRIIAELARIDPRIAQDFEYRIEASAAKGDRRLQALLAPAKLFDQTDLTPVGVWENGQTSLPLNPFRGNYIPVTQEAFNVA